MNVLKISHENPSMVVSSVTLNLRQSIVAPTLWVECLVISLKLLSCLCLRLGASESYVLSSIFRFNGNFYNIRRLLVTKNYLCLISDQD